jgi:hypothetical protein
MRGEARHRDRQRGRKPEMNSERYRDTDTKRRER